MQVSKRARKQGISHIGTEQTVCPNEQNRSTEQQHAHTNKSGAGAGDQCLGLQLNARLSLHMAKGKQVAPVGQSDTNK